MGTSTISKKPTAAGTSKRWKQLLAKAREMRGQSGLKAYDRAQDLVEVFNDRDFRAERGNVDDLKAAKKLDQYVGDLCCEFLELRDMLSYYPSRDQWGDGNLAKMKREMYEAHRKSKRDSEAEAEPITRTRPTLAEYKDLKKEADELKVRTKYQADEVALLREENHRLRTELARAEGRIQELERIVKLQPAAA